ncbi:MAG: DUF4349 domain-containing protein [Lachnospiraceae bacterium]|nr:DUF4349 domain-containing protein [Lachnospiraceae bacterium]
MKKRQIRLLALFMAVGIALSGCGSSAAYDAAMPEAATDNYAGEMKSKAAGESFATYEDAEYEPVEESANADVSTESASESVNENVATNRKLIKRVNITAETREFDKLTRFIEKRVEELGGYMENSDVYSGSTYNGGRVRSANYTARVPVARMNDLVEAVGENSNITNKSESAEDVTLSYVDNKSRKEALEVEMDRLMEILKQAEDVDTIIELERRITDVRYEIQNIESTLRTYDNLVDFATVNISVTEVEVYTPEPVKKQSDWDRMVEGFLHSLKSVGRGILNFLIDIVIALPYLILWAIIILVGFLIVRKWWRGRDKRAAKREEKKAKKAQKAAQKAMQKGGQVPQKPEEMLKPGEKKETEDKQNG